MAKANARKKSPTVTPSTPTRPGKHGGALRSGNPGNRGGAGRPPSVIREQLRGSIADRSALLEQIMDGELFQRTRVAVRDLLPYVVCSACPAGTIKARDGAADIEISALASASPKERIAAYDTAAKYGLGAMKEISVENVRERVGLTLDTIRDLCPPAQATSLIAALRPIWA